MGFRNYDVFAGYDVVAAAVFNDDLWEQLVAEDLHADLVAALDRLSQAVLEETYRFVNSTPATSPGYAQDLSVLRRRRDMIEWRRKKVVALVSDAATGRRELARVVAADYVAGMKYLELALKYRISNVTIKELLALAGVAVRPQGGQPGPRRRRGHNAAPGSST